MIFSCRYWALSLFFAMSAVGSSWAFAPDVVDSFTITGARPAGAVLGATEVGAFSWRPDPGGGTTLTPAGTLRAGLNADFLQFASLPSYVGNQDFHLSFKVRVNSPFTNARAHIGMREVDEPTNDISIPSYGLEVIPKWDGFGWNQIPDNVDTPGLLLYRTGSAFNIPGQYDLNLSGPGIAETFHQVDLTIIGKRAQLTWDGTRYVNRTDMADNALNGTVFMFGSIQGDAEYDDLSIRKAIRHVTGNFNAAGSLDMEIGGRTAAREAGFDFDQVRATGNLALGGVLSLTGKSDLPDLISPAAARGQSITVPILDGAGAVSGAFSTVTFDGLPFASYADSGVFLSLDAAAGDVHFRMMRAKLGDADGDLVVSATDVFGTVNNLGSAVTGGDWTRGNFDLDHLISATDVFTAVNNLGAYLPNATSTGVTAVPEPASADILAICGLAALVLAGRTAQGRRWSCAAVSDSRHQAVGKKRSQFFFWAA